jgi:hypothetical protein
MIIENIQAEKQIQNRDSFKFILNVCFMSSNNEKMKLRWQIKDIIDLEYFLGKDAPSETDRNIYLEHIRPLTEADSKRSTPRFILRQWLDYRRASEKASEAVLPGEAFDEIHQLLCYLLMIAGIAAGGGLAFSLLTYKGTEPLNVSLYLGAIVGVQLLLLLFLLSVLMFGMFRRSAARAPLIYSFLGSILVKMVMTIRDRAMKKLSAAQRGSLEAAVGLAKGKKTVYGNLFYLPLFIMAQLFGMGFNIGVLGATLLRVIGADIAFGWQSTVQLSPNLVYQAVRLIALPWSWFVESSVAHPTLAQIEGSRMILKDGIWRLATSDLVSWWPFLCFAVLCYGFLPRLILFISALIIQYRSLGRLTFNHSVCNNLLRRMETPVVSVKSDQVDIKKQISFQEHQPIEKPLKINPDDPKAVVLISDDIFEQCDDDMLKQLIEKNIGSYQIVRKIRIGADKLADKKKIADLGHVNVLILQEAWQPPIKEILLFLQEIRKTIGDKSGIGVMMIGRPKPLTIFTPVNEENFKIWLQKISSLADPYLSAERLVTDEQ